MVQQNWCANSDGNGWLSIMEKVEDCLQRPGTRPGELSLDLVCAKVLHTQLGSFM